MIARLSTDIAAAAADAINVRTLSNLNLWRFSKVLSMAANAQFTNIAVDSKLKQPLIRNLGV